jgi:hypothetical protein
MSKLTVREPFYFAGAVRDVGSPIEVDNAADRKSLIERGLIGEAKAEKAPENKALNAPENKALNAPENKSKSKG